MALLRLSIAGYASPRRLLYAGILSRQVCPTRGIVAGSSFATTELRLYLLSAVHKHRRSHPNVQLDIFVDDLAFHAVRITTNAMAEDLVNSVIDFAFEVENNLLMNLARDKAAVVANDRRTASVVRTTLADLGGGKLLTIRSLGIDFARAQRLASRIRPVSQLRLKKFSRKKLRLKSVQKSKPSLASKLFVCGVLPAVLYDSPVFGMFTPGFKRLRKEAGMFAGLLGRKRAPDLAFSFCPKKDPEMIASIAVVRRYCKEVWNAALPGPFRNSSGLTLGELGQGVGAHLSTHVVRWVVGPISATRLTLDKVGWSFRTPFMLVDKLGKSLHLLTMSPVRVINLFKKDLRETIARRSIIRDFMRCNDDDQEYRAMVDCGVFLQPLYALFDKLEPKEAFTVLRIASNGIFTNYDFMLMGYDVDPVCQQCFSSADTIFHRCYTCPMISARAELALGSDLFNRILAAGEDSAMATRCLHPAYICEVHPSPSTVCEFVNFGHGDSFDASLGFVFGDGSCMNGAFNDLARAGFAVAQIDSLGQVLKAIYGCVPGSLPQTSLSAEYAAYFAFATHANGSSYVGDCQEVLSEHREDLVDALDPNNVHACSWKALILKQGHNFKDSIGDVIKVKAHQAIDSIVDDSLRALAVGNDIVDSLAKRGAALQPCDASDVRAFQRSRNDIKNQVLHMVDCLKDLSLSRAETTGKLSKLPRGVALPSGSAGDQRNGKRVHSFKWIDKFWVCEICLIRTRSLADGFLRSKCCLGPPAFCGLLGANRLGHKLVSAGVSGGGVILYCTVCYHYASPHPRLLATVCAGKPCSDRSSEMFYLKRRKHPLSRKDLFMPMSVGV